MIREASPPNSERQAASHTVSRGNRGDSRRPGEARNQHFGGGGVVLRDGRPPPAGATTT